MPKKMIMMMLKNLKLKLVYSILFCLFATQAYAFKAEKEETLPYFASVKSGEVNVRIGPHSRYPIKFVFIKKSEPIEVIAKFEQWRKIRDFTGDEGWVHQTMIARKRYVIVKSNHNIEMKKNNKIIAYLEPGVRATLKECKKEECQIITNNIAGWVEGKHLWGTTR